MQHSVPHSLKLDIIRFLIPVFCLFLWQSGNAYAQADRFDPVAALPQQNAFIDTVALLFNYSVACDGSVGVHSPAWVSVSSMSKHGIAGVTLSADNSFNYDFSADVITSHRWNIRLQVDDPEQDASFTLCAVDSAGNSTCISNNYHVVRMQCSPRSINLGTRHLNSAVSYPLHVVNHGTGTEEIDEIELNPDGNKAFSVYVPGLPLSLAPGDSTVLPIIITCAAIGTFNDTLNVRRGQCISAMGMLSVNVTMADEVMDSELSDLTLFPNPANDHTLLRFDDVASLQSVEVYDALSKCVLRRSLSQVAGSELSLDLRALASGQYRCVVHSAQGIRTLPLSIVH